MQRFVHALAGSMMIAGPAIADITPQQVWDDWVAAADQDEAEITTDSVEAGSDGLVVRGLSMTAGTEDEGRYTIEVDEISFVQNDDGSVGVSVSPEYPIVLVDTDETGTRRETRLLVAHPDLEMTVSEEGGAQTHAFVGPEVRVTIDEATQDGEPLELDGGVTLRGVEGRYDVTEATAADSALSADEIAITFAGTDPEDGGRFDLEMTLSDVASANLLQLVGSDTAAMARDLPEGETLEGTLSAAGSSFAIDTESEGETVTLAGTTGPGESRIGLSGDGLRYASRGVEAQVTVSGSTIPLPQVELGVARVETNLAVPLLAAEEPQPYELQLSLLDVALDEGLWNMVDPAGILPRDPGDIVVDVNGDMTVGEDVGTAQVGEEITGQVESLVLETVRVAIADAEARATGSLEMADGPEGVPIPVGEIEVLLSGANQLLARLVQVGILPQEQAMGAQMMLGMFARPGEGEDEMVSRIRFSEDGHVFVNDQQVR